MIPKKTGDLIFSLCLLCLIGTGCTALTPTSKQRTEISPVSNARLDLHGQGLRSIPQDIFKRTDLGELDLSQNSLTGSIPAEIRFLSKLEVLDLSNNAMAGLPAEIGQLTRLKTLDLSNNQLTGLPLELGQLTNLETLDLRGNKYSEVDLNKIRSMLIHTEIIVD